MAFPTGTKPRACVLYGSSPQPFLAQGLVSWKTNFPQVGVGAVQEVMGAMGSGRWSFACLPAAHACFAAWFLIGSGRHRPLVPANGDSCCGGQNSGLDNSYQRSHLLSIFCVLVTWWKLSSFPLASKDRGLETLINLLKIMAFVRGRLGILEPCFRWLQDHVF